MASSALPGHHANATYALHEPVFDQLPSNHPKSHRRREVQKFRTAEGPQERPRWNASTKDEAHPFPDRPMMHASNRYDGVEVVETHFPESIKGTVGLRFGWHDRKPEVWTLNASKALGTSRYSYHCASLETTPAHLSYLAQKVVEDNTPEKKALERQWCASTALEGRSGNRFLAAPPEESYVEKNKAKEGILDELHYTSPIRRVSQQNRELRVTKRLQRAASAEDPLMLYTRADAPPVFTMSNIDAWWGLNPVAVAEAQTVMKETITANPFSTYKGSRTN